MPRKPIGDAAMSSTERVHRWRERHGLVGKTDRQKLNQALAEIERLKAELAAARAGKTEAAQPRAEPEKPQQAHGARTRSTPKASPTVDREEMAARMRADFEAYARECAQWGGRPRKRVIDDIGRLLVSRGVRLDDHVRETIINAMLPHVAQQANIERGISRRTYRKVLADLHTDRNPTGATAFVAFKGLDVRKDGKQGWRSIVIADDKVKTMADLWRKREERSARGRAAAAKRKAATGRSISD